VAVQERFRSGLITLEIGDCYTSAKHIWTLHQLNHPILLLNSSKIRFKCAAALLAPEYALKLNMTNEEFFEELKALSSELGIRVRFENGDFDGGYCLLREERMLVLNRRATIPRKIRTLALGLTEYGLGETFVRPALRESIEDEIAKARTEARV
jgi:hypothetical protein